MKTVGVIIAMEEEIQFLIHNSPNIEMTIIGGLEFYEKHHAGQRLILVRSGIGKVNASMAATLLITHFTPDYIINTGAAGGLLPTMEIGDIVVSTTTFHHDFDLQPIGFARGEIPGIPIHFHSDSKLSEIIESVLAEDQLNSHRGVVGSGEFFVHCQNYVKELKESFPTVVAVEMEAAAIAQVCYAFKVPFVVIRAISDVADHESHISFQEFVKLAGVNSAKVLLQVVEKL